MATVGVQKGFKVSVNEIDTLIGSKQKNWDLRESLLCNFLYIGNYDIWMEYDNLRYYPSNFRTIYAILSNFYGFYILLNRNFYHVQHNI